MLVGGHAGRLNSPSPHVNWQTRGQAGERARTLGRPRRFRDGQERRTVRQIEQKLMRLVNVAFSWRLWISSSLHASCLHKLPQFVAARRHPAKSLSESRLAPAVCVLGSATEAAVPCLHSIARVLDCLRLTAPHLAGQNKTPAAGAAGVDEKREQLVMERV
jgi:hypothetical protein